MITAPVLVQAIFSLVVVFLFSYYVSCNGGVVGAEDDNSCGLQHRPCVSAPPQYHAMNVKPSCASCPPTPTPTSHKPSTSLSTIDNRKPPKTRCPPLFPSPTTPPYFPPTTPPFFPSPPPVQIPPPTTPPFFPAPPPVQIPPPTTPPFFPPQPPYIPPVCPPSTPPYPSPPTPFQPFPPSPPTIFIPPPKRYRPATPPPKRYRPAVGKKSVPKTSPEKPAF